MTMTLFVLKRNFPSKLPGSVQSIAKALEGELELLVMADPKLGDQLDALGFQRAFNGKAYRIYTRQKKFYSSEVMKLMEFVSDPAVYRICTKRSLAEEAM